MHLLKNIARHCPYCGEYIDFLVDCSVQQQDYIEDCQVCCRPIVINVLIENQDLQMHIKREDDV